MGHGSYSRYIGEESPSLRLRIPRLRCKACGGTFGILPSFLVPRRHYSASFIHLILSLRYQLGLSRQRLLTCLKGGPALSTCLQWIRSFNNNAHLWLGCLLSTLARFDPRYDPVHQLVSPVGKPQGPPRLLLDLLPQLLAASDAARPGTGGGLRQGLGRLLLWGQGRRLPRLL